MVSQVTELEAEFAKAQNEKVVPTRYLRSQQARQAKAAAEACEAGEDGEDEADNDAAVEIDPYELMSAVDILSKLPSGFYDKVEAKKWQERKEAVDELEALLQKSPKLESGDYGDLVRALKKVLTWFFSPVVCVCFKLFICLSYLILSYQQFHHR